MRIILLSLAILFFAFPAAAEQGSSGLPLPRFASLKSDKVFARTGPGQNYPVRWVYSRTGLPVEIVQEFESWRKIRDQAGDEGWVSKLMLSGTRTALIKSDETVLLRDRPEGDARIMVKAEPGALAWIDKCDETWCRVRAGGYRGWLQRNLLWGIYGTEKLN